MPAETRFVYTEPGKFANPQMCYRIRTPYTPMVKWMRYELVEQVFDRISDMECDAEWCGKSPYGTPGNKNYDDGKCQVCKLKALTERVT